MPETLEEAYRIQHEAIGLIDKPVLGWKVAVINPSLRDRFGATRIAGPVFRIWEGDTTEPTLAMFDGGYAAAEAEIQLRIGSVPPGPSVSLEGAIQSIDSICIGIEAAGSPFADINRHGPAVTVSDFGNNNGLVIGRELAGWRTSLIPDCKVISRINGAEVGTGVVAFMTAGPFESVRFMFELAAALGLDLRPGQWISSGAVTGAHLVNSGDRFEAEFVPIGRVACVFEAT